MAFVSKANLNKCRQKQKLISKIMNNEKAYVGQEQVLRGITDFYKELYSAQPKQKKNDINFYANYLKNKPNFLIKI
jgi:hypothetical protein